MDDVSVPLRNGHVNVWHRPAVGDSGTVVLVHGLSGTSRWWSTVIEHLPDDPGIIAMDVRGRGGSHDSPPPYDLATMADDIGRCLDHFAVDHATVAGYSMGAWISAIFATASPERVARLLLVDGGFALPMDPKAVADEVIEAVVGPSLARLEVEFAGQDDFFGHWMEHPALKRHWDDSMRQALGFELHRVGDHYSVRINPQAVRQSAEQITVDPETRNAAEKVEVPTHLIVVERGTADQPGGMIPLRTAEDAAMKMPNLTMQYLPGVNHYTLVLGAGAPAVAAAIAATHH